MPGLADGRRYQSIDVAMRIFAPTERPQQIALVSCKNKFIQPSYYDRSRFVVARLDTLGDHLVKQHLICPIYVFDEQKQRHTTVGERTF